MNSKTVGVVTRLVSVVSIVFLLAGCGDRFRRVSWSPNRRLSVGTYASILSAAMTYLYPLI